MFKSMMGPNSTPVMVQVTGDDDGLQATGLSEIVGKRYVRLQLVGGVAAHDIDWTFTWNGGASTVTFTALAPATYQVIGMEIPLDFGKGGLTAVSTANALNSQNWLVSAWN